MSGKKTKIAKILNLVLGILLFMLSAMVFAAIFLTAMSLWWLLLPIGLIFLSFFVLNQSIEEKRPIKQLRKDIEQSTKKIAVEIKEEYQVDLNYALERFTLYAKGKISKEKIGIPEESEIYQFLDNSQKAHFMMDLHLEIARSEETEQERIEAREHLKGKVIPLLEESAQAFEKITKGVGGTSKIDASSDLSQSKLDESAENKVVFDCLFPNMEEKGRHSRIKRPIYHRVKERPYPRLDSFFVSRQKFVLFGIESDGNCSLYCINLHDRKKVMDLIIEHLDCSENDRLRAEAFGQILTENFVDIVKNLQDEELDSLLFLAVKVELFKEYEEEKHKSLKKFVEEVISQKYKTQTLNEWIVKGSQENLNLLINNRIRMLIPYKDNKKFSEYIYKYMQGKRFWEMVLTELTLAMHKRDPKLRVRHEFAIDSTPRQIHRSDPGENGFYDLVWGNLSMLKEANILCVCEEKGIFYYGYIHPNGKAVQGNMEVSKLTQAFQQLDELEITYEQFVEKVKQRLLSKEDQMCVFSVLLPLIAEQQKLAPKAYTYNSLGANDHSSRLVELDDYEELMKGKIDENGFNLCRSQKEYDEYERDWCRKHS